MARYPGALPPRSAVLEEIDWLLAALAEDPASKASHEERDRLAPLLPRGDDGGHPLHGDASISTLLSTSAGPRWNDFEDVCVGSPASDIAGLLDDARERYDEPFAADLLIAYRRDVDPTHIQLVSDVQTLYGTPWRRYITSGPPA